MAVMSLLYYLNGMVTEKHIFRFKSFETLENSHARCFFFLFLFHFQIEERNSQETKTPTRAQTRLRVK